MKLIGRKVDWRSFAVHTGLLTLASAVPNRIQRSWAAARGTRFGSHVQESKYSANHQDSCRLPFQRTGEPGHPLRNNPTPLLNCRGRLNNS